MATLNRCARLAASARSPSPAATAATSSACSAKAAFKAIKDYKTEMLCKPFTYGNFSERIPNNTDYTVTPSTSGGTMVVAQGCTAISSANPQIAAYHKIAGS